MQAPCHRLALANVHQLPAVDDERRAQGKVRGEHKQYRLISRRLAHVGNHVDMGSGNTLHALRLVPRLPLPLSRELDTPVRDSRQRLLRTTASF